MAKTYFDKLKDPRWQKKRLNIMQRDDFKCKECGAEDKTLNVHHGYYTGGKDPWDYSDETLHTVCTDCHERYEEIKHDLHLEIGKLSINGLFDVFSKIQNLKVLEAPFNIENQRKLWIDFFKYMDWKVQEFEESPIISHDFKITTLGAEYFCFVNYDADSPEKRNILFDLYGGEKNLLLLNRNPFVFENIPNAIGLLSCKAETKEDFEFCTASVVENDSKYYLTNLCYDIEFDFDHYEFCLAAWRVCVKHQNEKEI